MTDRVTPEARATVLLREGRCVIDILERAHMCRDRWGQPHPSDDLDALTLEHVKSEAMMGKRAPSTAHSMVAMCWAGNVVELWGSGNRQRLRDYLAGVKRAQAA